MSKLKKILKSCTTCIPSKKTSRQLITLRSSESYKRCLKHLKDLGISPFKTVSSNHMIGCYFNTNVSSDILVRHPYIKKVEKDFQIRAHGLLQNKPIKYRVPAGPLLTPATFPASVPWNICRVQAPAAWSTTKGKTIKVAILDTGIANHPDLRITGGINVIDGGSFADDNGHGTHVAGIVAATGKSGKLTGVAPAVNLYAVKALDKNGDGYVSNIIEGINWCIKNRMNVINMSFGILNSESSKTLHEAIKRAAKQGIIMVASAGNSGITYGKIDEPASFSETIAVAASTITNKIATFSSRGSGIGLTAPGENINSTWLNGTYAKVSGTSMSSPM